MTRAADDRTADPGETWAFAARDTISSWREMFDRRTVGRDVLAGVTTAMVALPLNVALAIACGLPPAVGLVTGAVSGVISSLVGGARLQVTGPEVALAPLTYAIVSEHGLPGLLAATFLAGLFQIVLGLLRVGRFVKASPAPVIGGFMAAVGILVFNSQIPRLLGLSGVRVVSEIRSTSAFASLGPGSIAIGASAVAALVLLPKLHKRIPAPLVAMAIGVVAVLLGVTTPTLAPLDSVVPSVGLPHFQSLNLARIVPEAIALALLASLDSLLCAAGMEARTGGPRVRADQELVAQGLANMASACVGGMPVAAAIVRSVAAHEAGARSRLAPLVQSVVLGLVLVLLAPLLPLVPIAALAGILLVVGYRLIDWRMFLKAYSASRAEAMIFAATAAAILVTDFVTGVGVGVILAVVDFARRSARIEVSARPASLPEAIGGAGSEACVVHLEGALFFGSHSDVERVLATAGGSPAVVVDLSGVRDADLTGVLSLARVVDKIVERGSSVWIHGARAAIRPLLDAAGLSSRLVADEAEALRPLSPAIHVEDSASPAHAREPVSVRHASVRLPSLPSRLQPSLE